MRSGFSEEVIWRGSFFPYVASSRKITIQEETLQRKNRNMKRKNRALAGPVIVLADQGRQSPSRGEQLAASRSTPGRNVDPLPTAHIDYGLRRACKQRRIAYVSHAVMSRRADLRML